MKAAEGVALEIVHDLVRRGLQTGDHLPQEAAMLRQYQVSRASLREALRILEVQGLISIKPGPGGGPVVGTVNPSFLARTQSLFFHLGGANYDDLFRTHVVLEPLSAELAACHPDRVKVQEKLSPFLGDQPGATALECWKESSGFHQAIQDLSANRVLSLITQSIGRIVLDSVVAGREPGSPGSSVVEEHAAIGRAVIEGQRERAAKLMREHSYQVLHCYEEHWSWRFRDLIECR